MILEALLEAIVTPAAAAIRPLDLRIGLHWTAVTLESAGPPRIGLAATQQEGPGEHHWDGQPPVRAAGRLLELPASELVELLHSERAPERSIGMAALNALLEIDETRCTPTNALELITEHGAGRRIALVGHFPFIPRLQTIARELWVLELTPDPDAGDLPASQAEELLPQADVVAMTGSVLLNGTFENLIAHCRPETFVIMLGATTPITPRLFAYGVDAVAGTRITDPEGALRAISQGATFPQIPGRQPLTLLK